MRATKVTACVAVAALAANLVGCATQPWAVQPVYVSSAEYASYDCKELQSKVEAVDIQRRQVTDTLQTQANTDAALLTVNLISGIFILGGLGLSSPTGAKFEEEELGRLKGEAEAISRARKEKGCDVPKSVEAKVDPSAIQPTSLPVNK